MFDGHKDVERRTGDPTHAERLASIETTIRGLQAADEEVKQSLNQVNHSLGDLNSTSKVNSALLQKITIELSEVKKKADFIPNTLLAAAIATAVTFGINTLGKVVPQPVKRVEIIESRQVVSTEEKEANYGSGSSEYDSGDPADLVQGSRS